MIDKYGRETNHQKRSRSIKFQNISLTLEKKLILLIEEKLKDYENKNMSLFIEENVKNCRIKKMPKRRKFKTFPVKKNFTFSIDFVKKIKQSGNMSLFIEEKLIEIFNHQ